jgi:hypothetical protein
MGKASTSKRDGSRREKIAQQRTAERRAEVRNRMLIAGGAIIAVVAIVVAFVVIKANSNSKSTATSSSGVSNGPTGAALAKVVADTTSVPASTLASVGSGTGLVSALPTSISGAALTANGKPEMLYMGAEYCPFCAAERWAMVVALSRFGTFSGLSTVHSGIKDGSGNSEVYPGTSTWTFYHSTYTSNYVTFTPVEMQTNIPNTSTGSGYTTLQTPTKAQNALIAKYDAPPYVASADAGAIPFVNFGNKYLIVGASYSPQVLSGLSWSQIAADLKSPSSQVAKAIDGTANYMTAALCKLTGDQPASACTPTVTALQAKI